jgi:competence protein ComEC
LSSLAFAALVMLVYDPHQLFDVGFQLSFAAVMAILLFAEPVNSFLKVDRCGRVVRYVVGLLVISVVAQVGTLPLVWYHFGLFPLYFLITNLFVVPLAFVVMSLAVLLWLFSPVTLLSQALSWLLNGVVSFMNWAVVAVAALPGASFALPSIGVVEMLLLISAATFVVYSLAACRWRMLLYSSVVTASLVVLCSLAGGEERPGSYMLIYNNRKNPLLHIVEGKANYLLSTVPELDAEYEYSSAPYVKREGLDAPCWVAGGCENSLLSFDDGLLSYAGFKVRLVDNAHWRENVYSEPADMVLLCRGFLGSIKELLDVYPTECLVMDASLYERSRRRIMRECAALDVDVVDVASEGALMFLPGKDAFELVNMSGK